MIKSVINKDFLFPLVTFLIWRILIVIFQIYLQPFYKLIEDSETLYQRLFLSWTTYWDSGHYLAISQNGYNYPQQAFFPFWPLFIKFFSLINIPSDIVMFTLSNILTLTTFIFFYKLAQKLTSEKEAKFSLIIFASFPSSMFLLSGYTESLFLTLTLTSFLLLENRKYFLSSLFAGLSSATRLVGFFLSLSYLFIKTSNFKKILFILISVSGLLFYSLYLYLSFSDPLLFIKATKEWCESSGKCGLTYPLTPINNYSNLILQGWVRPNLSSQFLDWISSFIFLALSIFVLFRFKLNYLLYTVAVLVTPLLSGSMVGMVRYSLIAFPIFFILPSLIKNKYLILLVCLILFLLQLRLIALFTGRLWVA